MTAAGIIGHEAVLRELADAAARDGLHHAYLFEGPRGAGKRRVADWLARLANCTGSSPSGGGPCGRCPECHAIGGGTHPDVIALEPDLDRAARTIPIEAIRETIRKAQYHRYGARHRFVIVDPAEAMQEPAANALLKTLEEPPADTHFVLITHNPRALLPTIRSRCQRMRFGGVGGPRIEAWLAQRGVEPATAAAATRLALGCPGRALALAERDIEVRSQLRTELARTLDGGLADVYAFSTGLTQGSRQDWADRAELVLELIEDLARDACIHATQARVDRLDPADDTLVARLARAWPSGIVACAAAVQEARAELDLFVSGKTVLDALLTAVQRELRPA